MSSVLRSPLSAFALLVVATFARAEAPAVRLPGPAAAKSPVPGRAADMKQRLREGAKLADVVGRFEFGGERYVFHPADGGEPMRVIENLSLERIGIALQESRTKTDWIVSGTVTEYRGNNFLLVTKAVTKGGEGPRKP